MVLLLFGAGLALLALGGEAVIRGGVALKRTLGIAPVIVGLFAISIGTASPTLAIAATAAHANLPDIAIGTVIGATLINLLLILGLCALIQPMPSAPKVVLRDGGAILAAGAALAALAWYGEIGRREGVLLLGAFAIYAVIVVVSDWRRSIEHSVACAEAENRASREEPSIFGSLFVLFVGAICLLVGAHFIVGSTLSLAAHWHLQPATVAMTAVAFGAALPVFAITAIAALRGYTHIAIGHLITASVFNVFGALGIAALVHPITISHTSFAPADTFAVLGAAVLLLPLLSMNWRLSRANGVLLMLAYIGYLGFTAWRLGLIPHVAGII